MDQGTELIVLGGGCFWCLEAVYQRLPGVISVQSGYAGGTVPDPSYDQVCTGTTGHAEVVRIEYNPDSISLESILEFFWSTHDATTLNRQGADIGTQYRSVIFYSNENEKEAALDSLRQHSSRFEKPIVTEIVPLTEFFPAETYHDNYYNSHPGAGYCRMVIAPKLRKLGMPD